MSTSSRRLAALMEELDGEGVVTALFEGHPHATLVVDQEALRVFAANAAACTLYGYSEEELLDLDVRLLRPAADTPVVEARAEELGDRSTRSVRSRHMRKDGTLLSVEVTSFHLRVEGRSLRLVSVEDISEREAREAEVRAQKEVYELLLQAQSDLGHGLCIVDIDGGRILHANEAFARITGVPVARILEMTTGLDLIDPGQRRLIDERMAVRRAGGLPPSQYEIMLRDASGRPVPVEVSIKRLPGRRSMVLVRDITERKRGEEALLNQQKMESLAVLAGGVAHDFNNLMSIILGNVDMASRQVALDSPLREWLRSIETAGMRAADIGQQMLAYSGKGHFVVTELDLSQLAVEMEDILRVTVGRHARLLVVPGRGCSVEADAAQMRQLLMNLVVNAGEACSGGEGLVTVNTSVEQADSARLSSMILGEGRTPGSWVSLRVTDTGSGMDAETVKRIFDPFFTTKFTGRGLGLSAVLGIVRGHKGAIRVDSAPGRGTTVEVLLPPSAEALVTTEAAPPPAQVSQATRPIVLVADDEEGVRSVVAKILERSGYEVITASDGEEAMELFRANASRVALVVLDMTMPVLSGEDALREIHSLRPDARVLLMSGFNEDEARLRIRADSTIAFIRKPFMPDELRDRVRRLLAG